MDESMKRSDIFQPEYADITQKWISRHIVGGAGMAIAVALLEIVFVFLLPRDENSVPLAESAIRFFIIPSGANFAAVMVTLLVWRQEKLSQQTKATVAIIAHVFIAFVVYTAHSVFPAICLVFAIPVVFSVAYGDMRLTMLASVCGLADKTISDLFIRWDPRVAYKFADFSSSMDYLISILSLSAINIVCFLLIRTEQEKHAVSLRLAQEKLRLYQETITDPLTGLQNRNGLRLAFDRITADPGNKSYWFAMVDMDRFKSINDTFGHAAGDWYLQQVSEVLQSIPNAEAFRFGGDEFSLILHDHSAEQAEWACRQAQERFRNLQGKTTTISFGLAPYEKGMAPAELVHRADAALYTAKQDRDAVRFYQPAPREEP